MGASPWELKVFEACGIPVHVHICLILYFAWALSNAEAGVKAEAGMHGLPDYSKAASIALRCTLGFMILFFTILIHELGHCLGAKIVGGKTQRILLWPLGGLAFCGHGGGPKSDLLVALAGPLTHVPQWLAWRALSVATAGSLAIRLGTLGPVVTSLCAQAMSMQIMLAAFNLLVPCYPLDCSKIVISLCRLAGASANSAALFMCSLSVLCIFVLIASMAGKVHIPLIAIGFHPINVMLVCWMAYQTYQLCCQVSVNEVKSHPLFNDTCQPCGGETLPLRQCDSARGSITAGGVLSRPSSSSASCEGCPASLPQ